MSPTFVAVLAAVLAFVAVAGFGLVLAGGSGANARTMKRAHSVVGRDEAREAARKNRREAAPEQRRRQIMKTLREQEKQQKKARLTLSSQLQRAGLKDDPRTFWMWSAALGLVVTLLLLVLRQMPIIALGLGVSAAFGAPRWLLGFLGNRRIKKFTSLFPDGLDVITRGIRSGLPVHDSLRMIGQETPEPLAGEFRRLVENLAVGLSVDQALERMHERMPTPEVRFFAIVLAIQQKTGGNLAEALGNLSAVIRARKMMREKIKAMSGEAVASAAIIGSLPPGVAVMISLVSPAYMMPMFHDMRGQLLLGAGALWMSIGVFVMRRMINFKI